MHSVRASHASHFDAHAHHHSSRGHSHSHKDRHSSTAPAAVQLPRTLARPTFQDVARDNIVAAAPDLANVPSEFIRHGLRAKAPQMLAGIAALAPSHLPSTLPKSHLPATLTIPLRAPSAPGPQSYPTHALAITPHAKPSHSDRDVPATIFPVHAVVLAAHCAALPRLPPARHPAPSTAYLPVLPLALPSPQAFAILHAFMYTHRLDAALQSLLPLPPAFLAGLSHATVLAALATPAARHQLAVYLCGAAGNSLSALMAHAAHVKELWQDMVALGLHDPELWDALDLAWEVVLGALNLAAK
ncbi:hypothetical protein C8J57DRAFT_1705080 [Mycena rebaudengoi]|nr:hypothetical protein C8J57DRAFT_1705080 [Mycena rebaudengoi]